MPDEPPPSDLYEQLCGELLIDPMQVSHEMDSILDELWRRKGLPR
jgi:hypothetical protein